MRTSRKLKNETKWSLYWPIFCCQNHRDWGKKGQIFLSPWWNRGPKVSRISLCPLIQKSLFTDKGRFFARFKPAFFGPQPYLILAFGGIPLFATLINPAKLFFCFQKFNTVGFAIRKLSQMCKFRKQCESRLERRTTYNTTLRIFSSKHWNFWPSLKLWKLVSEFFIKNQNHTQHIQKEKKTQKLLQQPLNMKKKQNTI